MCKRMILDTRKWQGMKPADLDMWFALQALFLSATSTTTDDVSDKIFHLHPVKAPPSPKHTSPIKDSRLRKYMFGAAKIATPFVHGLFAQRVVSGVVRRAHQNLIAREGCLAAAAQDGYQLEMLVKWAMMEVGALPA